jgi:hypothetical protein
MNHLDHFWLCFKQEFGFTRQMGPAEPDQVPGAVTRENRTFTTSRLLTEYADIRILIFKYNFQLVI